MIRLKEVRESRKYTQQKLADLLNVKPATISRYENGTNEPDLKTIKWYSTHFGVTTDYLLGLTDDPTPPAQRNAKKELPTKEQPTNVINFGEPLDTELVRLRANDALTKRIREIIEEELLNKNNG